MTDFLITAPLHEETRGKIRNVVARPYYGPRALVGSHCAYRDGDGRDYAKWGFGLTARDAVYDLLEKERGR